MFLLRNSGTISILSCIEELSRGENNLDAKKAVVGIVVYWVYIAAMYMDGVRFPVST